jgi:hypothetical protein
MSTVPEVKSFPASPSTTAAAATPAVKEDSGGIVAIAATEHAAAKGVFSLLKDKLAQGVTDVEAEIKKLESFLHL